MGATASTVTIDVLVFVAPDMILLCEQLQVARCGIDAVEHLRALVGRPQQRPCGRVAVVVLDHCDLIRETCKLCLSLIVIFFRLKAQLAKQNIGTLKLRNARCLVPVNLTLPY